MIIAGVSTALLTVAAGLGIAWYMLKDTPADDRQREASKTAETASFFTGFQSQDLLPVVAKKLGAASASCYVTAVRPEQKSGIRVGDIVVQFLDKPIGRVQDFSLAWPDVTAAKEYPMTVVRGGITQQISFKPMLTPWPKSDPSKENVFGERRRFDPRNGGRIMSRLVVAGDTLVGIDVDKAAYAWTTLDGDAPPVRLDPRTFSAVALDATGKTVALTDAKTGELVKWDPSTSAITDVLEGSPNSEVIDLLMTDDGSRAVIIDKDSNVRTWDLVARKPSDPFSLKALAPAYDIFWLNLYPGNFSLSGNGRHLGQQIATAFVVWDLEKKAVARVIRSETRITAGILSPDAGSLAIALENGTIEVWDVAAERKRATLRWHTQDVSSLTFLSPDFLVSSCDRPADGSVIVWDLRDQSMSWGYKATESGGGPFSFGPDLTAFRRSAGSVFMAISNIREMSLPSDLESSLAGASWPADELNTVLDHSVKSGKSSTKIKSSFSTTATFGDGRTSEIVDLDDGSKMVTDRDASGAIIGMEFRPGPRTVGLGIRIGGDDGRELERHVPLEKGAAVLELVAGGPAEREGTLRVGDVITAVTAAENEVPRPVAGLHVAELMRFIAGPKDTTVRLQVVRDGGPDPIEVVATRGRPQAIRRKPAKTDYTNSVGMEFLAVPGGVGFLGIDGGDANMERHYVRLSAAYLIGVHEVTQGEFAAVMTARPSVFSPSGQKADLITDAVAKGVIPNSDTAHHPVETVSWEEVVEFCKRLSQKEGRKYRLPTEAEWEWACRNAGKTEWKNGSLSGSWLDETSVGTHLDFPKTTHPVGSRSPNDAGLYDMFGNVAEWCADNFADAGFASARYVDPSGPKESLKRVIRGGSFTDFGFKFFSRSGLAPTEKRQYLGVRVVLELKPGLIEESAQERVLSEVATWVVDESRIPNPLSPPKLPLRSPEEEEKDLEEALGNTSEDAKSLRALRKRLKEAACLNQTQFVNFRVPWAEVNLLLGNNRPTEAMKFYSSAHSAGGGESDIALLNQAATQDSILGWVATDLAWTLATNADPDHRDPILAIIRAIEACEETNWQYWGFLDTLAASLAADGRHETATRVAEAALLRAPEAEKKQQERALDRYKQGRDWEQLQP